MIKIVAALLVLASGCGIQWREWLGHAADHCVGQDGAAALEEVAGKLAGEVATTIAGGKAWDGPEWRSVAVGLAVRYGWDCLRHAAAHLLDDSFKSTAVASAGGRSVLGCHRPPAGARPYLLRIFGGDLPSVRCPQ
jgi:hypothetical protein